MTEDARAVEALTYEQARDELAAGSVWQEWQADDRRSLVLIDSGVTTIVSGTGDWTEIESLAGSLVPTP